MDTMLRNPAGERRGHHLGKGITDGLGTCTCQASHKTHFLCCTRRCIPSLWDRKKKRVCLQNISETQKETQVYFKHLKRLNIYMLYVTFFACTEIRLCGSQTSSSGDVPRWVKLSNYLWRCLLRTELRQPLWDASWFVKDTFPSCKTERRRRQISLCMRRERTTRDLLSERCSGAQKFNRDKENQHQIEFLNKLVGWRGYVMLFRC